MKIFFFYHIINELINKLINQFLFASNRKSVINQLFQSSCFANSLADESLTFVFISKTNYDFRCRVQMYLFW